MHVPKLGAGAAIELTTNELLAALRDAPVVKKAVEDKSAAVASRRKQLADELSRLERQATKDFENQSAQIAAAQEAVKVAEQALQAARAKLGTAAAARSNASHTYDRQREAVETELRATAHPEIDTFIAWAWDQWYAVQRAPIEIEVDAVKNRITGRRTEIRRTNHSARIDRMNALRSAIVDAEDLRLAADQTSIPAQLDTLRASIPEVR